MTGKHLRLLIILYAYRMSLVCHSCHLYVTQMSLVYRLYLLVYHSYATCNYSYVVRTLGYRINVQELLIEEKKQPELISVQCTINVQGHI